MSEPGWWCRVVEYIAVAALVVTALVVVFAADESSTVRGRLWAVRRAWYWAASDSRTVRTVQGSTITCTSTKATALRLIQ
ncbi:hypothetical protein, partial [Streptosporangium sp. NPDC051022]|uniref:hypothetical protein n=1 Tax=Streptosporangium sp. NPDC051022 TaxID=3155752 RepID=UPI003421FF13